MKEEKWGNTIEWKQRSHKRNRRESLKHTQRNGRKKGCKMSGDYRKGKKEN